MKSLLLTSSPDLPAAVWVEEGTERDRFSEPAFLKESQWHTKAQRWTQSCTHKATGDWDILSGE